MDTTRVLESHDEGGQFQEVTLDLSELPASVINADLAKALQRWLVENEFFGRAEIDEAGVSVTIKSSSDFRATAQVTVTKLEGLSEDILNRLVNAAVNTFMEYHRAVAQ